MKCNIALEPETVIEAVNKSYYHGELKEKKKERYAELEKGRFPATQTAAKHFLIQESATKSIQIINKDIDKLKVEVRNKLREIRIIRDKTRNELGKAQVERKEFIMRCQVSECKGFLSTAYKCELCSAFTCSKCLEVINENHECKPENIASAETIKKETKPCPKCSTRIHKIDGCNQMWCTNCNTPWDWITQKVVFGTVHNPHYYAYLKTQNGVVPRAPGDMQCGGIPDINILQHYIRILPPTFLDIGRFIHNCVYSMHRIVVDTNFRIGDFNRHESFETNLAEVRVLYMLNRIDDKEFSKRICMIYQKRDKSRSNIRLLELITTIGTDLIQRYFKMIETISCSSIFNETCKLIHEFNQLIEYYESLRIKNLKLYNHSGVCFNITREPAGDGPIVITDKFRYRSTGNI